MNPKREKKLERKTRRATKAKDPKQNPDHTETEEDESGTLTLM